MQQKVLVIGLDGATWDLIKPWAEEGKLPTFKKLMENGVWGYLESTIPPSTAPAWSSFITGKKVETHKIFNFIIFDQNMKPKLISLNQLNHLKIWEIIGFFNLKSIIINFPFSFPPPKINGIFISGMFTPSKYTNFIYPKKYKKYIPKDYIIEPVPVGEIHPKTRLKILYKSLIAKFKAFSNFLNEEWNFFFILIRETDILQHFFWNNKKILFKFYKLIDKKLKEILAFCDKNNITLILMSDHGFQKLKGIFHISEFLKRKGYLVFKNSKKNKKRLLNFLKEKCFNFLIVHPSLKDIIKHIFSPIFYNKKEEEILNHIDINQSMAIHLQGYIYIPLKDCEERKKIISCLKKDMKNIGLDYFVLNYSHSRHSPNFPVFVIWYKNWSYEFSDEEAKTILTLPKRQGTHSLHGIFLAYGKDIKNTGEEIKNIKIYDIAPTILHMFGLPIPKDMDGRVLTEIFKENSETAKRKPVYVNPSYYSEKLKIKEKIKKLKIKGRI